MKEIKKKNVKVTISGKKPVSIDINNIKLSDMVFKVKKLDRRPNYTIESTNIIQAGIRG